MVAQRNISRYITFLDKCDSWSQLKKVHALLATSGLCNKDPFAWKILSVAATSASFSIDYAYRVFLQIANPTLFHYNAVIRGFSNSRTPSKCFHLFVQMLMKGIVPDHLTFPFLAKASARLLDRKLGESVHGHVLRNGYGQDLYILNSLIHMYGSFREIGSAKKIFDEMPIRNSVSWNSILDGYAKCGDIKSMREMFDSMPEPERDVVSWSALIDGYVKDGDYAEALSIFDKMRKEGPKVNEVTMVSVLCACSHLGALNQGRDMHRYILENGLPLTLVLRTSLVDMYAKCGAITEALNVFHGVKKTDVLIWNAIIGGLATHGFTSKAMEVFLKMPDAGIRPDEITYLCLLSACAHGGLVKEAWKYFYAISEDGMVPKIEHYACMIDVLARAGHLTDAYQFVCEMPVEPTASMLGALFNGCINHRNLDLAEIVGKRLIELDPDHDGRYIGLSNVYAFIRRWDEARSTREAMESRGVRKFPGCSYLEVLGNLHRFIAHDKSHPQSEEIYSMLDVIVEHIKLRVKPELISMPLEEYMI